MSNIKVTVQDANNVLLEVTPVPIQQIAISRGVAGRGISDVQAVEINNALYLEFFFTDGTTEIVGPVGTIQYIGESPIVVDAATISLDTVPISFGGTGQITANAGFNALAPTQTGNAGKYLKTDGTNSAWDLIDISTADITGVLPIANGGTGASTASGARTNLGLGTIATQNANAVAITGGSITGITDLAVSDGGTGASTAAGAMVNLLPSYTGNANKRLGLDSTATGLEWVTDGGGTVTSVDVSGGTTGLSFTGGPVTTGGTITLGGTLDVDNGGTGATTAAGARTNLNAADQALILTAGTGLSGGGDLTANRSFSIANTGVTAASYGAASKTLTATVNAQGQLTVLADTPIAIANTQISGLGTMSTQNASSVAITGGSITGITDLAVADGGTGASDASGARTNLGAAASATTISAGTGLSGGGDLSANRTLSIANTAVTAGSYGSASNTLTATVNAQGQLTALAATPIAIANTQISGLGTMSTQNSNSVTITGGSITGITDLAIADGGTGASTASGARSNLGLGTAAVLDAGVANGVATLDGSGTIPLSQIPASIQGGVSYQGSWNAATNTPTLTSSVGSKGYYYVVSVAGSTNLNGVTDWLVGDWAIFNGSVWQKIDNTDSVASVNGYTGAVVLTNTDVGAPPTSLTISAGTGLTGGGDLSTNRTLSIANTTVTAASYGSASAVPTFTVNGQGQLTAASNTTIAIANTQVSGLGTMSTQNANSVSITGGSITGITDLAIADGGTGASTAADARTNLGVTATGQDTTYLYRANNLSDLANAATARTNLGLGTAATQNSTAFATAAQGALADTAIQTLTSTDGSVTITPTGTSRDLSVAVAASTTNVICQVRNTTGATLTKGTVVYISGATGQIPTVSKALATSDATSAQTLGMMTADLANNTNGYVTIIGLITNIDTSSYTDGQQLYLSGTTAGAVTATKPYAPIHLVYVAVVEYAHPVNGKLFVKVQNGYELDEIHNVSAQTPSNGQTIVYNSSNQLWENNTVSLTLGVNGVLPIANGGTGQTTANAAFNALAPSQTGNSGKYLTTDGSNTSWATNPLGTVTSVSGTGTVNGLTLTGTVTTSGSLTLGGTLSGIPNSALTNSSITIGGTAIALGGSSNALANDITIYGVTVGRGAGAISSNTAVGASALAANTTGTNNTAFGELALSSVTTAVSNTAIGQWALKLNTGNSNTGIGQNSLGNNTTGTDNVAVGTASLFTNDSGVSNVAVGRSALRLNTTGSYNTVLGMDALRTNTTASYNTAVGYRSAYANTTGTDNNAFGRQALEYATTASVNAAFGSVALGATTTGAANSAFGVYAMSSNTTGSNNVSVGYQSLNGNTTANNNTAVGYQAGFSNTTGYGNAFVGTQAGYANTTGTANSAFGSNAPTLSNAALQSNSTGSQNSAFGVGALGQNSTASNNTAVGFQAAYTNLTGASSVSVGYAAGYSNTTGSTWVAIGERALYAANADHNVAIGSAAMISTTSGNSNVGIGKNVMLSNTTGSYNTAVGMQSLNSNTTASNNVAIGYQAGLFNTTGAQLTAIGANAGRGNTTGLDNSFVGYSAGYSNSTGSYNTVLGKEALANTTTGSQNTAVGFQSLYSNTTASYNIVVGGQALYSNLIGAYNTVMGYQAGYSTTSSSNTIIGYSAGQSLTSGSDNTAVGTNALGLSGALGVGSNTGTANTAVGSNANRKNTSGSYNVAFGSGIPGAYAAALQENTTGSNNTALGNGALGSNTTASANTAVGYQAAYSNTTGAQNTATGHQALLSNTTGTNNVAYGYQSLNANTTADDNVAYGVSSMLGNTTGTGNAGLGRSALRTNTTGNYNTAVGMDALRLSTTASYNTAVGYQAAYTNTTGSRNTAVGYLALNANQTGLYNCAFGFQAGFLSTGLGNTLFGDNAGGGLTTGKGNTFLGSNNDVAGACGGQITTGNYNTIIGSYSGNQGGLDIRTSNQYIVLSDGYGLPRGIFNPSDTFSINYTGRYSQLTFANTNVAKASIWWDNTNLVLQTYTNANGPYLSNGGTSWTNSSDERLKNITGEIQNGLAKVCTLRAAEYTWKSDAEANPKVGLIAQDVLAVLPEAVNIPPEGATNRDGSLAMMGVQYTDVIPLLVAAIKELKTEFDAYKASHP